MAEGLLGGVSTPWPGTKGEARCDKGMTRGQTWGAGGLKGDLTVRRIENLLSSRHREIDQTKYQRRKFMERRYMHK